MFLGIDIGSSSSKAAILSETGQLMATGVSNLGTGTKGPEEALSIALQAAGIKREALIYTVATGYGRIGFRQANEQITEISCHAKGVTFLSQGISTIIDIGGQDAKVIRLGKDGKVTNFVMNEKCAAGTGRFLEVMARVLGYPIGELSVLASKSTQTVSISSVCTVFAESEVISRLSSGAAVEDVARGAHAAIAKRIAGMCSRVGSEPLITMTGGVALNQNVVQLMEQELGQPICVLPHCQEMGAIGAAAFAYQRTREKEATE